MREKSMRTKAASAIAMALSMILPTVGEASAAHVRLMTIPIVTSLTAIPEAVDLTQITHRSANRARGHRDHRRINRGRAERRDYRSSYGSHYHRDVRRHERYRALRRADRDRFGRGHRRSRVQRHGYRQNNDGWWYPLAAFALGAVILNEVQGNRQQRGAASSGWSHIPAATLPRMTPGATRIIAATAG